MDHMERDMLDHLASAQKVLVGIGGEWKKGKVVQKGTQAKMARGEMVRFMGEKGILNVEELCGFDRLGYHFEEELSSDKEYVFIRN